MTATKITVDITRNVTGSALLSKCRLALFNAGGLDGDWLEIESEMASRGRAALFDYFALNVTDADPEHPSDIENFIAANQPVTAADITDWEDPTTSWVIDVNDMAETSLDAAAQKAFPGVTDFILMTKADWERIRDAVEPVRSQLADDLQGIDFIPVTFA